MSKLGTFKSFFLHLTKTRIVESFILLIIIIGFITVGVGVLSGNWQIRPILSGSMEPGFSIGGVAITQRVPIGQLKVGDVAVFHPPGLKNTDYIHRVTKLVKDKNNTIINTKGDMNTVADPWTLKVNSKYAYVAKFTLPLVGFAAVWLHSPSGRQYTLTLAVFLALLYLSFLIYDHKKNKYKKKTE